MAILDEKGPRCSNITHGYIWRNVHWFHTGKEAGNRKLPNLRHRYEHAPEELIHYVLDSFRNTEFFLDTVSTTKAKKIISKIGRFHTIKPNKIEAELLSGISIETQDDLERAADYFLDKGVQRVFITLGSKGVFYSDGSVSRHFQIQKWMWWMQPEPEMHSLQHLHSADSTIMTSEKALIFQWRHQYSRSDTKIP